MAHCRQHGWIAPSDPDAVCPQCFADLQAAPQQAQEREDAATEAIDELSTERSNLSVRLRQAQEERDDARGHWTRAEQGWNRVILQAEGFQRDYLSAIERGKRACEFVRIEARDVCWLATQVTWEVRRAEAAKRERDEARDLGEFLYGLGEIWVHQREKAKRERDGLQTYTRNQEISLGNLFDKLRAAAEQRALAEGLAAELSELGEWTARIAVKVDELHRRLVSAKAQEEGA